MTDAASRYFRNVFPLLRGARSRGVRTPAFRGLTEPGHDERIAWVVAQFDRERPRHVLDVGCGQGACAIALARRGHPVTALDISPVMLEAARRAACLAGVADRIEFVEADFRGWTPLREFDDVLCIGVAEYYPPVADSLERLLGWARERLLVTLPRRAVGPRRVARRVWLAMHGLSARLFDGGEALAALQRPGTDVQLVQTHWAYCAQLRRL